jgi:hypothetical protein
MVFAKSYLPFLPFTETLAKFQSKLSNILYTLCLALSNIEGKNFIWLSSVKGILNECGLAYIWNTQTFQNTEWLSDPARHKP